MKRKIGFSWGTFFILCMLVLLALVFVDFDSTVKKALINTAIAREDYHIILSLVYRLTIRVSVVIAMIGGLIVCRNSRIHRAMQAEKELLRISEERYRIVTENSDEIIFEYIPRESRAIFSSKFREVFGRDDSGGPQGAHSQDLMDMLQKFDLGGEDTQRFEVKIKNKKGDSIWCKVTGTMLHGAGGEVSKIIGKIRNIDLDKRQRQILKKQAESDMMTGLYNKYTTQRIIDQYLHQVRDDEQFALLLIDIDNFKGINDSRGHLFGDRVIKHLTENLRRIFRESDILGRVGGDEFVVFLRDIDAEEAVLARAELICDIFHSFASTAGEGIKISGSVGVAMGCGAKMSFSELYQRADIALYQTKHSGKDGCSIYRAK